MRAVVDRELTRDATDEALLMLERMRMIDTIHYWSVGTHKTYQGKLRFLRRFERRFGISLLTPTPLQRPPVNDSIPLMWAQEHYSLQKARWTRGAKGSEALTIKFNTVRGLRSAASMFHRLDMMTAHPGCIYSDPASRVLQGQGVNPTDELGYAMMSSGMRSRLGTDSKPSAALLYRHVQHMMESLEKRFRMARHSSERSEICRAALATLFSWLAWLRGAELFNLAYSDIDVTLPGDGAKLDVDPAFGALGLRLQPDTKSSRDRTADVPIAFETGSGLKPGMWYLRLLEEQGLTVPQAQDLDTKVFTHASGVSWDSSYYRTTYLYPALNELRLNGDPALRGYDGTPGNSIRDKFWAMHSFRRGGRTHVSRRRAGCIRKASKEEINEHGRWRTSRANMDMATAYLEWSIADRLSITQYCM